MKTIEETISEMLVEPIDKYLGDSGGAYGYQYERNRDNGILKGDKPIEFDINEADKETALYPTTPIYDFLTTCLIVDEETEQIYHDLIDICDENDITFDYGVDVEDELKMLGFFSNTYLTTKISWENTYNYDNVLSQDILFCIFSNDDNDFVLLSIHNGCDIRSGYTYPKVFKVDDIDYFLIYMRESYIGCHCDVNSYHGSGYELCVSSGEYVDNNYVYANTYEDEDGLLRCKHCNEVIVCGMPDY